MDWKQITGLVVGVVIGALLLTMLVIPVIGETTATERTITNDGYYQMADISDMEWELTWDSANPRVMEVNGKAITVAPEPGGIAFTLLGGEDLMVRYFVMSNNTRFFMQVFSTGNSVYAADSNSSQDMHLTYSNGTLTCDNGSGSTLSVSVTDPLYGIVENGEYILKKPTEVAHVLIDSPIKGIGITALANNVDERFVIEGTLDDGFTAVYVPYEITISDITPNYEENDDLGLIGVYDFTSLTFTATYNDEEIPVTYSQVLVPYQITAELSEHLDSDIISIMQIIPLLITVGIIMAVVGVFVIRRE